MRRFIGVLLMLALPVGARAQTNFTVVNFGFLLASITFTARTALRG